MKKYFTTGLAILLPVLLTIFIVGFFVNIITHPFLGTVEAILGHFEFFNEPFSIFQNGEMLTFFSKLFILVGIILTIFLVGFLGKLFLIDYLFKIGNMFFHNLPYFNTIYKSSQDIVHGLFSTTSKSFSQVVLVPFPTKDTMSIGLVTREFIKINDKQSTLETIPVFVPGTPNPSVGFMLMFKRDELIPVDMKVDDALKFVVSCGVVKSEFSILTPADNKDEPSHESPST